jgi:ubiquinol oxidase
LRQYADDGLTHDWYKMNRGYDRHNSLGDRSDRERPIPTKEELTSPELHAHYPPQTLGDKFAYQAVEALKPFTHAFFRDKYNHHAVVLETVAAVPGMVGGAFRHLRSLRRMQRDNGWIHPLWEEAENERMHLLIWMQVTKPTALEKALVVLAQSVYGLAYTAMYLLRPQVAHRFVGYLEEEAVAAYTAYLKAIETGALKNGPAPEIAKKYYRLPDDATLRDVILYVRIDECMHRYVTPSFRSLIVHIAHLCCVVASR